MKHVLLSGLAGIAFAALYTALLGGISWLLKFGGTGSHITVGLLLAFLGGILLFSSDTQKKS